MNTLKSLLGEDADQKISTVLSALQSSGTQQQTEKPPESIPPSAQPSPAPETALPKIGSGLLSDEGLQYLGKIKGIFDELGNADDKRSRLLMSLKPFMRPGRRASIDNTIKLLNISRMSGLFKL